MPCLASLPCPGAQPDSAQPSLGLGMGTLPFQVALGWSWCLWAAFGRGCAMLVASSHPVIHLLHLSPSPLPLQAEEPAAEGQHFCEEPGRPLTSTQRREGRRNEVWRLILATSHIRKIKNSGQEYKKGGKLLRACSWKPRQPWFMHPARYFCTYLN